MNKTERLSGIVFALKESGKLTAKDLATQFEVSERTIYRDIDALSQLKVPIIAYEGLGGGYEIDSDFFLPSLQLSAHEILLLLMVLRTGEGLKIPNMTADYQLLKGKIINALADEERLKINRVLRHMNFYLSRIMPNSYTNNLLVTIIDAFREIKNLEINYYHPKRNETECRIVSPTELFFDEGGWYLAAHCHLRKSHRVFRLDRMHQIKLLDSINTYLDKPIAKDEGRFKYDCYEMWIDPSLYRIIKENDYMQDCQLVETGERLRVRISTTFKDDMTHLVLSHPQELQLIGPESFMCEIEAICRALHERYNNNEKP